MIALNKDAEHLQFIHDRLQFMYAENPRFDYMRTLQSIIDALNKPETTYDKLKRTHRFTV
jgi:hypothetical protein